MNNLLFIAILVISNLLDGTRDGNILRKPNVSWQPWHFIKWLSFHSLTCSILLTQIDLYWWPLTAILCHFAFKIGYQISLTKERSWIYTSTGLINVVKDIIRNNKLA